MKNGLINMESELLKALKEKDVKIIGDEKVCQADSDATLATEEDWYTEYSRVNG